jgi:hypothetical protein
MSGTVRYSLTIDPLAVTRTVADLADALAHSAGGAVVSTVETLAVIDVPEGDNATCLAQLCDDDPAVLSYRVTR